MKSDFLKFSGVAASAAIFFMGWSAAYAEAPVSQPAKDPEITDIRTTVRQQRDVVSVVMDQALVVRAPKEVKTMILGNPTIADIASEGQGVLVVTGKAYGSTNLVLVDENGRVLGESLIQVLPPRAGIVTVQKGDTKEAYSCTPRCMPTSYVGTSSSFFSEASSQAQQRYGQIGGGGGPGSPPR